MTRPISQVPEYSEIRQATLDEVQEWLYYLAYYRSQSRFTPPSILKKFRNQFMPAPEES